MNSSTVCGAAKRVATRRANQVSISLMCATSSACSDMVVAQGASADNLRCSVKHRCLCSAPSTEPKKVCGRSDSDGWGRERFATSALGTLSWSRARCLHSPGLRGVVPPQLTWVRAVLFQFSADVGVATVGTASILALLDLSLYALICQCVSMKNHAAFPFFTALSGYVFVLRE